MKKRFILFVIILISNLVFSQSDKPTLIILPSEGLCLKTDKDKSMDYNFALENDTILKSSIQKLQDIFFDRGFLVVKIEDLENSILKNEIQKSDYLINIGYKIDLNSIGMELILKETYWNEIIATSMKLILNDRGKKIRINQSDVDNLLLDCVDNLNSQFFEYFERMDKEGRKIKVIIRSDSKLIGSNSMKESFIDILTEFISDNNSNGDYEILSSNATEIQYILNIPMFKTKKGKQLYYTSESFGNDIKKYFKTNKTKYKLQVVSSTRNEVLLEL